MMMLLVKIAAALLITAPLNLFSKWLDKPKPIASPTGQSKKSRQSPPPKRFEKTRSFIALSTVAIASVLSTSGIDKINDIELLQ